MIPRCVIVERPTEYRALLDRHATREQARFFIEQRGMTLDDIEDRDRAAQAAHAMVVDGVPPEWRATRVGRAELDRFLFEPDDVVIAIGQDGLVANVAKYLTGQPVIGIDPLPGRHPGVLVPHAPEAVADLLADLVAGRAEIRARTMVEAQADDGQRLLALNELFIGNASHQSARYELVVAGERESQSSSGVIVATGTGATGWAASINRERSHPVTLPEPGAAALAWFVREAWPSPSTGATLTAGQLGEQDRLTLRCEGGNDAVVFGDGVESDALLLTWGQGVSIGVAEERLRAVA